MEIAEHFLCPQIDATLSRITMGQLNHRNALRPEEQNDRNNPEPDGHAAVGRNARHDIEVEHGYNEQPDKIPAPQSAFQVASNRLRYGCLGQMSLPCSTFFEQCNWRRTAGCRPSPDLMACADSCVWLALSNCERGCNFGKRRQVLFDIRVSVGDGDGPLLVPPIRLCKHAAIDHREPVMPPEFAVHSKPVPIIVNRL